MGSQTIEMRNRKSFFTTLLGLVLTLSTGLVDEMDETAVIRVTGELARVFAAGVSLTRKPVAARK
jgi:hypothetical protein